jgi:beta-xylosidase
MPRRAKAGCNFHWTFDPKVIEDGGRKYLYYGSYGGGIFVTRLSDDGLRAEGAAKMVGAPGRYEGAEVKQHDGWWYMFASATDCCNGPLTGYAVFTGRARTPEGPFLDRYGNDMAKGRSGGTPLLLQNGNRWTGVGHNTVFTDAAGQRQGQADPAPGAARPYRLGRGLAGGRRRAGAQRPGDGGPDRARWRAGRAASAGRAGGAEGAPALA